MAQWIASLKLMRFVVCEHCGEEYVYRFTVAGHGGGAGSAERDLAARLQQDDVCSPVPCPGCLKYQRPMYAVAGHSHYAWLAIPIFMSGCLGLIVMVAGLIVVGWWTKSAAFGLGMLGLLCSWRLNALMERSVQNYNPNTQSERHRADVANRRAKSMEEFQEEHACEIDKEYAAYCNRGSDEPFVVDVWVTQQEVDACSLIPVELPDGTRTSLLLNPARATHSIYPLLSSRGGAAPFLARVCIFNRNPTPA
ncbi:MAG: hypothetical protein U0792_24320 [Gemmataceae bacterium]